MALTDLLLNKQIQSKRRCIKHRLFEHNNLRMITEMSAAFRQLKLLNDGGKIMISHMSRYAHESHDKLNAYLEKYDIGAASDGMEINF